jgi:hypothetical protein
MTLCIASHHRPSLASRGAYAPQIVALAAYVAVAIIRWTLDSAHLGLLTAIGVSALMGTDLLLRRQLSCRVGGSALAVVLTVMDLVVWMQAPSGRAAKKEDAGGNEPLSPV